MSYRVGERGMPDAYGKMRPRGSTARVDAAYATTTVSIIHNMVSQVDEGKGLSCSRYAMRARVVPLCVALLIPHEETS